MFKDHNVLGDFGFTYTVEFRFSQFLQHFVGEAEFRIISSTFHNENLKDIRFVLKQLGTDISWEMSPYQI